MSLHSNRQKVTKKSCYKKLLICHATVAHVDTSCLIDWCCGLYNCTTQRWIWLLLPLPPEACIATPSTLKDSQQTRRLQVTSSLLPLYLAIILYGTYCNQVFIKFWWGTMSRSCTDLRVIGAFLNNNLFGTTPGTVILVSISPLLGELSSQTDYLPSKLFFNSLCSLVLNPLLEVYLPKAVFWSGNPSSLNFPLTFWFLY